MASITTKDQITGNVGEAPLTLLLGTRWVLGMKHLLVTGLFGLFFVYLTYLPLFHSDLWDHVAYGQKMIEDGRLLHQDPFLPLAEGVSIIPSMWLSKVTFAWVESQWSTTGLSTLFAASIFLAYVVMALTFFVQSGRLSVALAGAGMVFLVVGWTRHIIIRPEMFGGLCFVLVMALAIRAQHLCERATALGTAPLQTDLRNWYVWLGIPVVFALWANLHGSFMCGLAMMGCFLVGHVIAVAWKVRDPAAVCAEPWVRRWLLLVELAVIGAIINPFGIDLVLHNLLFASHENLQQVTEWDPLVVASPMGFGFLISWVALAVVIRNSRRKIRASEVLLLTVFTLAALLHVRMLSWYAPIVALVLVPHLAEIWNRWRPSRALTYVSPIEEHEVPVMQRKSWSFTICTLGILWICFALSSFYSPMVTGTPRKLERIYHKHTPRELTAYLRENPPQGQVYNPQLWGGWIVWDGHTEDQPPPQVFMTVNMHVVPTTVWHDYLRIYTASMNWQSTLERYRVNTVIVDKAMQKPLHQALRGSSQWSLDYQDKHAAVYLRVRSKPVGLDGSEREDDWLSAGLALTTGQDQEKAGPPDLDVADVDEGQATPSSAGEAEVPQDTTKGDHE